MAAQQLKTFADIYNLILEEVKIQSGDTVTVDRIKRDVNAVYLNEVVPAARWFWLRREVDLVLPAAVTTGTVSVTNGSKSVTLSSAPATSKRGHLINVGSDAEIYRIAQHAAGATAIVLEAQYVGSTNATAGYTLWNNRLPLPTNTRETIDVWLDKKVTGLEGLGLQKWREHYLVNPLEEGSPRIYSTDDYIDPAPYSTISGLASLSTRASAGLVKTLVFDSDVSSDLEVGDRIEISSAGDSTYNGEFIVSSVATTTITYTALEPLNESPTADGSLVIKLRNGEGNPERYRELLLHPAIDDTDNQLLHVTYAIEPPPLEADSDEPLLPIEDRIILAYGGLVRAWSRERNTEEAQRNGNLFVRKLSQMEGKLTDSTDHVQMTPSKSYLAVKRARHSRFKNFLTD